MARAKNRSKYNVKQDKKAKEKRVINGYKFDSDLEARYYEEEILPLVNNPDIKLIEVHPVFVIQDAAEKFGKKLNPIRYEADFAIYYTNGEVIVIDVKGLPTEAAKLKRKMFDAKHPHKLKWIAWSKKDGGWVDYDELQDRRKKDKKAKKAMEAKGE